MPGADDAAEVRARLASLKQRLAKARAQGEFGLEPKATAPAETPSATALEPPAPIATVVPIEPLAPAAPVLAAEPKRNAESVAEQSPPTKDHRMAAWIVYGGAGAALLGGVITNLAARSKMNTCRSEYNSTGQVTSAAQSACDAAKPLAYVSYGLFGVTAAAAAVATVLVLRPADSSTVSVNVAPAGGLALAWSGRFR
jgi:hypothetical protein